MNIRIPIGTFIRKCLRAKKETGATIPWEPTFSIICPTSKYPPTVEFKTQEEAGAIARQLADKHKGSIFGVYQLVSYSWFPVEKKEAKPTL